MWTRGPATAGEDRLPWLVTDRGIATAVVATMALGLTALLWMLQVAGDAPTAAQRSTLRIDAIKYGVGYVAAAGGLAALLLAVRRQRLAERAYELAQQTQAHTEQDARERRVTELYTKAVELLGSPDAAVRLGALYALDRLAQDNVGQRQPIVNVVCALLRMPFAPPVAPGQRGARNGGRDPNEQLQVRVTAQGILTRHLCCPPGSADADVAGSPEQTFWPGIDIDLTGARLVDWSIERGRLHRAVFTRATFDGRTRFDSASFADAASFAGAVFAAQVDFGKVRFDGPARFDDVRFQGVVTFEEASFGAVADFDRAVFAHDAEFSDVVFGRAAGFAAATFLGRALFRTARFTGVGGFRETTFHRRANFSAVSFAEAAAFSDAKFHRDAEFDHAEFGGEAWFTDAEFATEPDFTDARRADRTRHADWPAGWRETTDPTDLKGGRLLPVEAAQPSD
ncbi:pentapeptide repeat-containing protein [Asanoa siamensis]|uniref:Pentapeptide repeat-containing protein n=1 Tax=Asanoa siamensis TaxID=926357 RepID=A0ABQ4CNQ7_9ACTN|nr:pentapeptide repeat-containing protein [Asanoa siamensis]GIF72924.1 hypothetical protein Asi02nite_24420 [Asanoa siamensis]